MIGVLMLATAEDVSARLGRTLSAEEALKVESFIQDCSAFVEDYCGIDFERRENQTFEVPATSSCELTIPRRYVHIEVSSVSFDGGDPLSDWELVGRTLVREAGWDEGNVVTITASWGYEVIPAAVKAAACAEVIRWLAVSPGIMREKVGELEVQFGPSPASQTLSQAAKDALRRYRQNIGSLSLVRG